MGKADRLKRELRTYELTEGERAALARVAKDAIERCHQIEYPPSVDLVSAWKKLKAVY